MPDSDDFKQEREAFDDWYEKFLKINKTMLLRDKNGEYSDETIMILFAGFCAGWHSSIIKNA
jgi:hypothetical protein